MTNCSKQTSSSRCQTFMTADQAGRSHCDRLVWFEIFSIQNAILDGVRDCEQCVTISNSSPITSYAMIESVTIVEGGQDYFPVEAEVDIIHPEGSGADIEILISATGEITSFNVNVISGGNDYDPVVAQADGTVSGDGNAAFDVVVNADGEVSVVPVLASGTGYSVGDPIPIVQPDGGTGAIVEVATVGNGGEVLSTVVINGGSGYQPIHAEIEIIHPTGFGFEGVVNVNSGGAILGISILSGGVGYTPLFPTLSIDGGGQGASFSFEVDASGTITDVIVNNGGFGYSEDDNITVVPAPTSDGADAELELVISESTGICTSDWPAVNPMLFYQVYTGQVINEKVSKQIKFIKEYFECLGYEFRILPNPDTGGTLMWKVCW